MASLSAPEPSTSLRQGGVVGERLRNAKAAAVADALGKSDSWVDKVRNGESGILIHDIPALLEALGLKCVGAEKICVDREIYVSLKTIAGAALEAPRKLEWE
jgi:hypothetical protein